MNARGLVSLFLVPALIACSGSRPGLVTLRVDSQNMKAVESSELCATRPTGLVGHVTQASWRVMEPGVYRVTLYNAPVLFTADGQVYAGTLDRCYLQVETPVRVTIYRATTQEVGATSVARLRYDHDANRRGDYLHEWVYEGYDGHVDAYTDHHRPFEHRSCQQWGCFYY